MDPNGRSSHYGRNNYSICNECDAHLNQANVITHMTDVHCDSYFYQCHLCRNYSGPSKSSLFQHQKDKHDVSYHTLACPICMKFISPQENEVMTHLVNVHSRKENLSVHNYCTLKSKFHLDTDLKKNRSRYDCVFYNCKAVCQNPTHLFQHYMGHHFPKLTMYFGCSECDFTFPHKNSLYQHKRDKHGILEEEENDNYIWLDCLICSFKTCIKKEYRQHTINKHPDYFFNCTFQNCDYQTELFWSLTQHTIDKHLSQTYLMYDCYICDVSYSEIHSLIQHLGDKHSIYDNCTLCNTYEDDLYDHILSVPDHSYNVFSCTFCNKEYEGKDKLVQHLSDKHVSITPLLRKLCYGD